MPRRQVVNPERPDIDAIPAPANAIAAEAEAEFALDVGRHDGVGGERAVRNRRGPLVRPAVELS